MPATSIKSATTACLANHSSMKKDNPQKADQKFVSCVKSALANKQERFTFSQGSLNCYRKSGTTKLGKTRYAWNGTCVSDGSDYNAVDCPYKANRNDFMGCASVGLAIPSGLYF